MELPAKNGQLTLVALFGDKKKAYSKLWDVIVQLQVGIERTLGNGVFERYDEVRVHGTVIGLEGFRDGEVVYNTNCYDKIRMRSPMDLVGLLDYLLADNPVLPLTIKVGGFTQNISYPFTSRGQSPYLRSFSIQGEIAVAMGWPMHDNLFTSGVDTLRRLFNQFNVLHKYHDSSSAYDNDFFFVLGNVPKGLNQNMVDTCQNQMRNILSQSEVPPIEISKDQLNVVAYHEGDTRFIKAKAYTLDEVKDNVREFIQFYPERGC